MKGMLLIPHTGTQHPEDVSSASFKLGCITQVPRKTLPCNPSNSPATTVILVLTTLRPISQ